jgi:hypothetical protein
MMCRIFTNDTFTSQVQKAQQSMNEEQSRLNATVLALQDRRLHMNEGLQAKQGTIDMLRNLLSGLETEKRNLVSNAPVLDRLDDVFGQKGIHNDTMVTEPRARSDIYSLLCDAMCLTTTFRHVTTRTFIVRSSHNYMHLYMY